MRVLSGFAVIFGVLALSACALPKYEQNNSQKKKFSPYLHEYGDTIPAQWQGRKWDPQQWPVSFQNKQRFTQNLFDADIMRAQYIEDDSVPIVVVGPNFYHLSDLDQQRICETLDMLYGATTGKYGHFLLKDWYSNAIIGDYTKTGLTLR